VALVFAAWDADYGYLVLVEGVERGELRKTWLDGIPEQGEVQGDPAGPRRGITTPGPSRPLQQPDGGQQGPAGHGRLRRQRGRPALPAGRRRRQLHRAHCGGRAGDVRRFARVRTDSRSRVHIVAHAPRTADGQTGLRYSVSPHGDPQGPADFFNETIESVAPSLPSTPLVGDPADGTGIAPCLAIGPDDRAYVAFYNSQTRRLTLAVQAAAGFALYSSARSRPRWPRTRANATCASPSTTWGGTAT
jgi:hypothetical protein